MDWLIFALLLPFMLVAVLSVVPVFVPNILVSGEPGSGKSVGTAHLALAHRGPLLSGDPHEDSTSELLLEHKEGNILFLRIDDEDHPLGCGLLRPAPRTLDPRKRRKANLREAKAFAQILMSRRGGNIATTPLMEEYTLAMIQLLLFQHPEKDPSLAPYAFRPETAQFKALLRDCEDEETRDKFALLASMKPRAVRTECGSAIRLADGVFRNDELLDILRPGVDLGAFWDAGGWLLVEGGKAAEDVKAVAIRALARKAAEYCTGREEPYPPLVCILDECTNVGPTAQEAEQRYAAENRKYGQHMWFICQHPNFYDPEAFFQVCQEKHIYRCADDVYARKQARMIALAMGQKDLIDEIASELMNFKPGQRYVVGRGGVRRERVPMLKSPWPDWPGLREAKLREKLQCIYSRQEYRKTPGTPPSGDQSGPSDGTSPSGTPSPSGNMPGGSGAADRLKRTRKKPPGSS